MALCTVCGKPVPFYRGSHPACAQRAIRAEITRHWEQIRAEQASGTRDVIGATVFVFDVVRSSVGHKFERVKVPTICWAYRRQVTKWVPMLFPIPIPIVYEHELVIHAHDGASLTSWKVVSFVGSKDDVHRSIAELMRRVPWALFGFTAEARAAMAPDRRLETTRDIEARRIRLSTEASPMDAQRDLAAAAALDVERVHAFGTHGRD